MPIMKLLLCLGLVFLLHEVVAYDYQAVAFDYKDALTKSLLYYEGQRSGKLPDKQRVTWRGDSGLNDGSDNKIDLVGGYYDAGDNVKFGFPMAYTITMLAWSVVEFEEQLASKNELENARDAIKWGTDYLIKSHPEPEVLYAEVGDGDSDHACWERPEDMTTPRTSYKIDVGHPGADLVAQTAAAMAATSVVFSKADPGYATTLLDHAKQLFDFANKYRGLYSDSIPIAKKFYSSSDDQDELLWASTWLYRATGDGTYMQYIDAYNGTGWIRSMFSWDDKYVGVQLCMSKMVLEGKLEDNGKWHDYKAALEEFVCNCIQKGNSNVKRSPGGLNWWDPWNNLQYTTSASFVAIVYAQYLGVASTTMTCPHGDVVGPDQLVAFAKSQVDYILGGNPKGMSYMVGFGQNYPTRVHHRGASIVSIKKDPTPVGCNDGMKNWFEKDAPNPNVLDGAIVGGPYDTDEYTDARNNFQQSEPTIANVAPLVGVLAKLG